ncbi:MAG: hypothetical protein KBD01_00070 [Acidobacteria bacterium]|nr:hypothetical protein [Acidobacteriota bacterium]
MSSATAQVTHAGQPAELPAEAAGGRRAALLAVVVAVDLAAACVLGGLLLREGSGPAARTMLPLVLLAGVAGLATVRIPSMRVNLTPVHALVFCALLTAGALGAIIVDLAGVIGSAVLRGRKPLATHFVFNLGAVVLASAAAALAFAAAGGTAGAGLQLGPLLAAATSYFVVASALVSFAIAFERGLNPLLAWARNCAWSAAPVLAEATVAAAMMAVLDRGILAALLLAAAPTWLLIRFYRLAAARISLDRP